MSGSPSPLRSEERADYATTEAGYKNPQERVASAPTESETLFATVRQIEIYPNTSLILSIRCSLIFLIDGIWISTAFPLNLRNKYQYAALHK